jgi:hypothetical protein
MTTYESPCLRGYPEAAAHLLDLGLTPAPNVPALRSMWKAGGHARQCALIIAAAWELVA